MKTLFAIIMILLLYLFIDTLTTLELFPKYIAPAIIVDICLIILIVILVIWARKMHSKHYDFLHIATYIFPSLILVITFSVIVGIRGSMRTIERCGFDVYYTDDSYGWANVFEKPSYFPIYISRPRNLFREQEKTEYEVSVSSLGMRYPDDLCDLR